MSLDKGRHRAVENGRKQTMRTLEPRLEKHIDLLITRYPVLGEVRQAIIDVSCA